LNGDTKEFLDISVTTSKHVSVCLPLSNKTILGKRNGVQYQGHAFASNVVGDTGPWGDDHLSITKTK
jgi:hypothetical protein